MAMGSSDFIEPQDLPSKVFESTYDLTMNEAIDQLKREYVASALTAANGNWKKAAAMLNMHPRTLRRTINKLNAS